jgi:hypothetical protein
MATDKVNDQPRTNQLVIHIGFLPALEAGKPEDAIERQSNRETERAKKRVKRLNALYQLEEIIRFQHFPPDESARLPVVKMRQTGDDKLTSLEQELQDGLKEETRFSPFMYPESSGEIALLVTNGRLANGSLAFIYRGLAILSSSELSALSSRIRRDPWPALALLALIIAKAPDSPLVQQSYEKLASASPGFGLNLSADEFIDWILGSKANEVVSQIERIFPGEVAKKLHDLLDHLPPPGGLDDSDVRATSYSDPIADEDHLGFSQYVEAFKRIILHRETNTPLAIAVIGEWGKGKSSFMRFLRRELERHRLTPLPQQAEANAKEPRSPLVPRAVTVWFDAWQYDSEEKVLAALLQTVAKEIEAHFTPYSWLKYRILFAFKELTSDWKVAYRLLTQVVLIPLVMLSASILVFALGPELAKNKWDIAKAFKEAMTNRERLWFSIGLGVLPAILYQGWQILSRLSVPLGINLNKLYEEKDHSERLGYLSVFKEEFQRRIAQMGLMPTWSLKSIGEAVDVSDMGLLGRLTGSLTLFGKELGNDLRKLVVGMKRPFSKKMKDVTDPQLSKKEKDASKLQLRNRVVVFIDDLDRCRPDKIVDTLEAIKVSLDTPGIIFVLGMDDQYIKTSIYQRYQSHIETQKKLYGEWMEGVQKKGTGDARGAQAKGGDLAQINLWPDRYLEKVIQISFRLPDASGDQLGNMVANLVPTKAPATEKKAEPEDSPTPPPDAPVPSPPIPPPAGPNYEEQMLGEIDSPVIGNAILDAAKALSPVHRSNPRRIRGFVNRCRLGLYLLKLRHPEIIHADYEEAINCFREWEQDLARNSPGNDFPIMDDNDVWYSSLKEIRKTLFGSTAGMPIVTGRDRQEGAMDQ